MNIRYCAAALAATSLFAGETRYWQQGDFADYEKAALKGVSLRSDGRLTLAPEFREKLNSSSAYLWALALDSRGTLYAGGGPEAKVYRVNGAGESKTFDIEGLQVQAIAIDKQDRVYAATSPDGKVWRLEGEKFTPFYDPKTKYIWAMAFAASGDLLVATGAPGAVHRVKSDGKGAAWFSTEETHARSLVVDSQDRVIVGTEPGGLIIRVTPAGEAFVLHQMAKREVTALAAAADGSIYAAAVGTKSVTPVAPAPAPAATPAPTATQPTAAAIRPATPPPSVPSGPAGVTGGSEVVRILPDGQPRNVWSHSSDIVYALALDASGRLIAGTGNKGQVYRLEADNKYTLLVNAPPTQVTALAAGRGGSLWAATGNAGKVFQIGPGLEKQGTVESEMLDAGWFSRWGRLSYEGAMNGGAVMIAARSGNLESSEKFWSPWGEAAAAQAGGRIAASAARFLQWRATLRGDGAKSPELDLVEVAYLPKNVAPVIDAVEPAPANFRFPAPVLNLPTSRTLSLPAIGKRASESSPGDSTSTPTMQFAKGWAGARWAGSDENRDSLVFAVEIRGVAETEWKKLQADIRNRYLSWDSAAFPDGEYRVRVTASDSPSNAPDEALVSAPVESPVFVIDNTPPRVTGPTAIREGAKLRVQWRAEDALNIVAKAEYSVDGGAWTEARPTTGLADSKSHEYSILIDAAPGEHTIAVRVEDYAENSAAAKTVIR